MHQMFSKKFEYIFIFNRRASIYWQKQPLKDGIVWTHDSFISNDFIKVREILNFRMDL